MGTKTPSQVATEFLTQLGALKPDVDISLTDSDWYVKAQTLGGVMAGIYSDQDALSNDPFPQSARLDALLKHLNTYFQPPNNVQIPAQQASGYMAITGVAGMTVIPTGMQATYGPNGNVYQSLTGFTMSASAMLLPMQSLLTGQNQNILSGAPLTISSPPAGLNGSAYASGDFQLGRDIETPQEAAARILAFIQTPPEGGTTADYKRWALESDPHVTNASVIRFPNGFGTVAVIITAGTTNINDAIDAGEPVVISVTQDLINTVQAYIDANCPITDCPLVIGPSSFFIDVSVSARFIQGDATTVIPNQSFTQGQLIQNSVMKAIYATPPGGRRLGSSGYMVKSDIEEQIDGDLSGEPFQVGGIPILADRYVGNLSGNSPNIVVPGTSVIIPRTITVVTMT